MAGLGTSLFYSTRQTYVQDENGQYTEADPLHFIAALPIDLVLGYGTGKLSVYARYRYMLIGPYTEILPAVPNSLLGLGIRYTFNATGQK
jgi:hypothetical protein